MIPHLCPFELKIKMADEDEVFRKFCCKTPERMADFEKPCFSLELEIFKSTMNDGEPAPAEEMLQVRLNLQINLFQPRSLCFNLSQLVSTQVSLGQV